ncbi:MAG TPA: FecR domain-containing protein [Puia sp.]|jgi:ferric-dicitrate binding protein FerR (iron transport regulator)
MDNPETEHFSELLDGYLRESLNPQELALFFELASGTENSEVLAQSFRQDLENGLPDLSIDSEKQDAWTKLSEKLETNPRPVVRMRTALRWVAIVVCLLGAAIAVFLIRQPKNRSEMADIKPIIKTPSWLKAEHTGATLILSAGDSVMLDNQDRGVIATQGEMQVLQSGGVISYSGMGQTSMYNEIRTGKGKLWRAILPDQTVVWLNGNSSVKYPLQFASDARSVEMTGEVYFEVTHHAGYPFRVKTGGETIEDIGTSFNVRSFADDSVITSTLVQGSVRIDFNNQQAILSPGQQSVVSSSDNEIRIEQNANIIKALAWKNGYFYFQNAALPDVMKQLSDWYQVGVVYKGKQGNEFFSGQIDKSLSLSDVLKGLQQPGVKFILEEKQITVIQQ